MSRFTDPSDDADDGQTTEDVVNEIDEQLKDFGSKKGNHKKVHTKQTIHVLLNLRSWGHQVRERPPCSKQSTDLKAFYEPKSRIEHANHAKQLGK